MEQKKIILNHLASYSVAVILTQLISVATGVLSRNFLGPAQMGIWATVQLVLYYSSYSALGTSAGIARRVPFYLGRKEEKKAAEVKDLVFTYQTGLSILTSLGLLAFALLFRDRLNFSMFWGLIGAGALLVLQRVNGIQVSVLRAYKKFGIASRLMLWSAVVNLGLVLILAPFLKFYGFVIAMVLSFIFNIMYSSRQFDFDFKIKLNSEIKKILAFAFPLMIFGIVESFFKTIDKIMIVKWLGFKQMGYYTVAIMFSNFLAQLPNSFGIVMIPHFEEKYGAKECPQDIFPYVEKSLFGLSYSMMVIVGMAWFATPFLVSILMPEYAAGVVAAKFLILASYFVALATPYSTVIVTLNKQLFLLPLIFLTLGVAALLNIVMIRMGFGIDGVAFAMMLSFFIYFLCFHILINYFFQKAKAGSISLTAQMLRFGYFLFVILLLDHFLITHHVFLEAALKVFLFLILMIPVISVLNRDYKIFSVISNFITSANAKKKKLPELEEPLSGLDDDHTGII